MNLPHHCEIKPNEDVG